MLSFGHFYLNGVFVLFDVARESVAGHTRYVVSLSADPRIFCTAVRPESAVQALEERLLRSLREQGRAA